MRNANAIGVLVLGCVLLTARGGWAQPADAAPARNSQGQSPSWLFPSAVVGVGVGVASVLLGAVFVADAWGRNRDFRDSIDSELWDQSADHDWVDQGQRFEYAGAALLAAGAVLMAAAIVALVVEPRLRRRAGRRNAFLYSGLAWARSHRLDCRSEL